MQTKSILTAVERDRRIADISKRKAGAHLGCRSSEKNAQISFYNSFLGGTAVTLEKLRRIGTAFHKRANHYLATNDYVIQTPALVARDSQATYGAPNPDKLSPAALTTALKKLAKSNPTILGGAAPDTFSPAAARAILRAFNLTNPRG